MDIKQQAGWFRGFLDSLLMGENVTIKQIEIIKKKIEELIDNLQNFELNDNYVPPSSDKKNSKSYEISESVDDLPF